MSPLRLEAGENGFPKGIEFQFNFVEGDQFQLATTSKNDPELDTLHTFGQELQYGDHSFTVYPQPELASEYQSGRNIFFNMWMIHLSNSKMVKPRCRRLLISI